METKVSVIGEISLDGYEVVRGEFMSQAGRPLVVFNGFTISFNAASLKILPEAESILFMVNRKENALCVRPCRNGEKGAFRWCGYGNKRGVRQGTCKEFVLRLMKVTAWTFDYKYKLMGSLVKNDGVLLLKFDLTAAQKFPRKNIEDEKLRKLTGHMQSDGWNEGFGSSLPEYEKDVTMPIFQADATIIIGVDKESDS